MQDLKDKLIVALDVDTLEEAEKLVEKLKNEVKYFKIGSQLFTAAGQEAIAMVAKHGGKVFLDSKFYDIPNTVYSAVCSSTASTIHTEAKALSAPRSKDSFAPVFMMTVHTLGGMEMLQRAAAAARDKAQELNIRRPYVVGVTVLTSDPPAEQTLNVVLERAQRAQEAGLDGVVCSVKETAAIREKFGPDFIIVNPGIRSKGSPADDQKRTGTALEAINAGASFIVVGRPILKAADPLAALKELS